MAEATKVPVVNTKNFIIYLENDNGFTFIHCDVLTKWSKKVKEELLKSFQEVTSYHQQELFALHTPNDKKHEKFLKLFGFKYFQTFVGLDERNYDIYIWR
jgi:hypothetical protein